MLSKNDGGPFFCLCVCFNICCLLFYTWSCQHCSMSINLVFCLCCGICRALRTSEVSLIGLTVTLDFRLQYNMSGAVMIASEWMRLLMEKTMTTWHKPGYAECSELCTTVHSEYFENCRMLPLCDS